MPWNISYLKSCTVGQALFRFQLIGLWHCIKLKEQEFVEQDYFQDQLSGYAHPFWMLKKFFFVTGSKIIPLPPAQSMKEFTHWFILPSNTSKVPELVCATKNRPEDVSTPPWSNSQFFSEERFFSPWNFNKSASFPIKIQYRNHLLECSSFALPSILSLTNLYMAS